MKIIFRIFKHFTFIALFLFLIHGESFPQQGGTPSLLPTSSLKGVNKQFPIIVNGDKVEYIQAQNKIIGTGNVSVTYGDVKLTCDQITVFTDTQIGLCEGNVRIAQTGSLLTGDKIEYNFGTKTGKLIEGHVSTYPIHGYGSNVAKVSDDEVILNNGYATTCDCQIPHYRIVAKEVQLFIGKTVIARQVYLYLHNTPVFYIPYYIMPLNEPKTKITIMPGYRDEWGYYALGSYRYYLNEQMKGYLRLDYRHKRGLAGGVDNNYKIKGLGEGLVRYYYTQENNELALSPSGPVDDRYRIQYKHKVDFNESTSLNAELNKTSDVDMVKDYFYQELDDGWTPENYISIMNSQNNYSMAINTRMQLDDFVTVTQELPSIQLDVYNQRLWDTRFYYTSDMEFTNFYKKYAISENMPNEDAIRFDTYHRLSYATKIFKFLNTTPYIATRQTYYSENRWRTKNQIREIYEYGIDFSTKFYKIFDTESEFFDIHQMRHIITPTVGFHHRHQPTIASTNLFQFDEIDSIGYENLIALSLENKLQTKRKYNDKIVSVDYLRFIVSTQYLYRFQKGNLDFKDDGRFSDIVYDLELRPYDWMFIKTQIDTYVKNWRFNGCIKSASTDFVCDLGEKFSLGLGHRYENSPNNSASQITSEMKYKINKDWGIRAYERFDAHTKKWEEQEYTLYKDMHCWLAEFTCNLKEGQFAFWAVFRVKAFPELPIGFKRTYRRPRPGANL